MRVLRSSHFYGPFKTMRWKCCVGVPNRFITDGPWRVAGSHIPRTKFSTASQPECSASQKERDCVGWEDGQRSPSASASARPSIVHRFEPTQVIKTVRSDQARNCKRSFNIVASAELSNFTVKHTHTHEYIHTWAHPVQLSSLGEVVKMFDCDYMALMRAPLCQRRSPQPGCFDSVR